MSGNQDDIGRSGKSVALEQRGTGDDGRRFSPSAARNRDVISEVFAAHMPMDGDVLEVASGTGEHGVFMVSRFPGLGWTYSDVDENSLASQRAWMEYAGTGSGLKGPVKLDASQADWGEAEAQAPYDGIFCANMIHISPFSVCEGLLAGAGRLLRPRGRLFLYGPFAREGEIAPSNARFSEDLKRRDPEWGVRDLDREVLPLARKVGLDLAAVVEMPANNLSVIFEKR